MQFGLFLLVTAILIVRPTEVVSGLAAIPIYEAAIVAALITAAQPLIGQLTLAGLVARPVSAFVLGVLAVVVLSHLLHGAIEAATVSGVFVLKIVLYYLLAVANLRTVSRLRVFILWVCGSMMVQIGLALLQYFGFIDVKELRPHRQREHDSKTGELLQEIDRLCGSGIFHDPNDLCVLLVVGVLLSLFLLNNRRAGIARLFWALPLGVFAVGIPLTHSRGGLLAVIAGVGALVLERLGRRRGLFLMVALMPVGLVALGGRMTKFEMDNPDDTSQHRLRAWSDGLQTLRSSPIFGLGQGRYPEVAGLTAHNSYVEVYTELGFVGGTCFVGAFVYSVWTLVRLRRAFAGREHLMLARFRPYLLAINVALMAGMFSVSRNYGLMTYLILGLTAGYLQLVAACIPKAVPRLSTRLVLRLALVSCVVLLGLNLFTIFMVQRF